jgi:predicted nucleotidyltransferase
MRKSREQILDYLRNHKDELRERFGVTSLGLSGSYARNESTDQSDVDIIVSLQSNNRFRSFFGLLHFLQDNLDERVDLATEASLKPRVKKTILRDIHYV